MTGLREACGVIGIYAPSEDVARLAYFGLYALQHRGQESAGHRHHRRHGPPRPHQDGPGRAGVRRAGPGRASSGLAAIGHTRYSTTGSQPRRERPAAGGRERPRAAGARAQRQPDNTAIAARRSLPSAWASTPTSTTDSEIARPPLRPRRGRRLARRASARTLPRLSGAFCLTLLTRDALYAVRDPLGIRPLCLGRLDGGGWVVASESCALDTIGAQFIREIDPAR